MDLSNIPLDIVSGSSLKTDHSPRHLRPLQVHAAGHSTSTEIGASAFGHLSIDKILSVVTCEKDFALHISICSSFTVLDLVINPHSGKKVKCPGFAWFLGGGDHFWDRPKHVQNALKEHHFKNKTIIIYFVSKKKLPSIIPSPSKGKGNFK